MNMTTKLIVVITVVLIGSVLSGSPTPPPSISNSGRELANWRWRHKHLTPTPGALPTATPTAIAMATPTATFTPTPTATVAPKLGLGIMYLFKSDRVDQPISPDDLPAIPAWTNSHVKGVALRTQWDRVEPREGELYWAFLDKAVELAIANGKKISILVTAGVTTPEWVFAAGASYFEVTEQAGVISKMGLPWDSIFQTKWRAFVQKLSERYGNKIAYVVMGGFGRRAESFFVTTQADQNGLDTLARSQGFTNGLEAWLSGAKWCVDQYGAQFTRAAFICDLGSPYPTTAGNDTLQQLCDYSAAKYPSRFAVKSDGLAPNGPPASSIGAKEVIALSPTALVGYQFGLPQKGDTAGMKAALDRGIGFGAHFIEVYAGDCDDPMQAANLDVANTQILSK